MATCSLSGSLDTEYQVEEELPSPDGSRRAVLYVGMGGGAAGWCYQRLVVLGTSDNFQPKLLDTALAYVFSASCGSKVEPQWLSDSEIEVSYSISDPAGVSLYQRASTPDREVALVFVPKP